jgi:hypothetical protein
MKSRVLILSFSFFLIALSAAHIVAQHLQSFDENENPWYDAHDDGGNANFNDIRDQGRGYGDISFPPAPTPPPSMRAQVDAKVPDEVEAIDTGPAPAETSKNLVFSIKIEPDTKTGQADINVTMPEMPKPIAAPLPPNPEIRETKSTVNIERHIKPQAPVVAPVAQIAPPPLPKTLPLLP